MYILSKLEDGFAKFLEESTSLDCAAIHRRAVELADKLDRRIRIDHVFADGTEFRVAEIGPM